MEEIWLTAEEGGELEKMTKRAIQRRIKAGHYKSIRNVKSDKGGGNGGMKTEIALSCLSPDAQKAYIEKNEALPPAILPALAPEAALAAAEKLSLIKTPNFDIVNRDNIWSDETALSPNDLRSPKITRCVRIVQEAMKTPRGWKKRAWIEAVALKHDTTAATIYRYIKRYKKKGLAGLKHTKPTQKDNPKSWTPEAIDFWLGLCLKKEHRKISKDQLYRLLVVEASKRTWRIGSYRSALWWFEKKATPQLLALQRGGVRALDNTLPPVLRDYSDLAPFEILVGDQHRFDFWVVDDDTGEVFRPEGYFWQDLRTRCFYGGAVDKKYDAYLMGLALRMGMKIFGPFDHIYTDHGRPEESRYIMGIMKEMRDLGLMVHSTEDIPVDLADADGEEINPCITLPGSHRKAIVRNAKAKMIEKTNSAIEAILKNQFRVPGNVKKLGGNQEENDIDQKDIERLAAAGKLLTFREFVLTVLKAMDYYNARKAHRGVIREWAWKPKPKSATPMDCLRACHAEGWRPVRLTDEAVDLIFLAKDTRIVDRGRITFRGELYEHERLADLHRKEVSIRFDPFDPEWLIVFYDGEYICRAEPVEYSSMKDMTLAQRKIEEKRRLRKASVTQYRELTSHVPDFREYSQVPEAEKPAALMGKDIKAQQRRRTAEKELSRVRTPEELAAEVARIESYEHEERRPVFSSEVDRYRWCLDQMAQGASLSGHDRNFIVDYEAGLTGDTLEYWGLYKESIGLAEQSQAEGV